MKIHIWELFFLTKDFYFCPSNCEIYRALTHSLPLPTKKWEPDLSLWNFYLEVSSPSWEWTEKAEAAHLMSLSLCQSALYSYQYSVYTATHMAPCAASPSSLWALLYSGCKRRIPCWIQELILVLKTMPCAFLYLP